MVILSLRRIVRSTKYHSLKRDTYIHTYPDSFRYFTQVSLSFCFISFFRTHVGWHTRAGTGSHPSSSLSIRSLKNYVTYPDKVAHLFKIKNCIILDPTTIVSTRCDLVETNCTCNVTNAHTHTRMHACIRNEIYSLSLLSPLNLLYIPTLYPFSLSKYYHKVYFSIFRTAHVAGDTTVSSWSWNEARVSTW